MTKDKGQTSLLRILHENIKRCNGNQAGLVLFLRKRKIFFAKTAKF